MKKILIILLGVVSVVAIGVAAYAGSQQTTPTESSSNYKDYKVYKDDKFVFSFLYSPNLAFRDSQHSEEFGKVKIGEFVNNNELADIERIHEGGYASVGLQVAPLHGGEDMNSWINERIVTKDSDVTADLVMAKGEIYIIPDRKVQTLTLKGHKAAMFTSTIYLGDFLNLAIQQGDNLIIFTSHRMSFNEMVASLTFSSEHPEVDSTTLNQIVSAITSN